MKNWGVLCIAVVWLAGCASNSDLVTRPQDRQKQVAALVDLGVGYLKNGEYTRAKENLNHALQLNPRSAKAHNALALIFQFQREFHQADKHFKLALRYDPKFTRARNNYGAFLYGQGRIKEAIEQLKIAAKDQFYDQRPTVFENLGICYMQLNDKKDAEDAFVKSIALNPRQSRALLDLAELRFGQKQYQSSRELFARYESVAQDNAASLWLCVRLAKVFRNPDKQASCAMALKNIYPASAEYKQYEKMVSN